MEETTAVVTQGMEAVLTEISSVVTNAVGWMGDIVDEVAATPVLLLMVVAIPLVGLGIGLLKRLIG